jgi:signal peptidase II
MNSGKKFLLIGTLMSSCIGCDQTTKYMATSALESMEVHSYFNDFVRLQYAENPGGMLSFGAELPESVRFWFLTVFVGLVLLGILIYLLVNRHISVVQTVALTCIVAGGFSNLLDRLLHEGHVIDFLNIGVGTIRTAIFNLADVVILLGAFLLLIASAKPQSKQPIDHGAHQT